LRSAALLACALVVAAPVPARAGGMVVSGTSGPRSYQLYVPGGYSGAPLPLVMMLHGCTQDPSNFMAGTRMNDRGEANGFFVLYPGEPSTIQSLSCWQWFDGADQMRGSGEPADLVAMLDQVASQYAVDASHVYVAGISAGAAMAVILGATYPDRFAGIGVGAGVEYGATTSGISGSASVQSSGGPDPAMQGQAAFAAMGAAKRVVPTIVIYGTQDAIVAPVNDDQVITQWATTDGLAGAMLPASPDAVEHGAVPGGHTYTTSTWHDVRTGAPVLRKIAVDGMGHAWSGGDTAGTYTDPMGPNASDAVWAFFSGGPSPGSDGGASGVDGGAGGGTGGGPGDMVMAHGGCACSLVDRAPSGSWLLALLLGALITLARRRAQR
jgi:poly(hydroxyalkanoate) depolymerase family esterase